ncbi:MAG: preprotein translocase subunit SecY [Deltaproteobacteria bacterium]|nr:preprotein translocase subunit SecY [Deltaproteobacteria bacterium]MBN2673247.1 preprotein translocase subunit SecY [Deltaproteobacteria bacterium]
MASGIANIGKIPELRKRIFFTLTMLAVYRIGIFVTTPGVDREVMGELVRQSSGTFMGLFNMFSGGALERLSIMALGIMPYISSSIILQLLSSVVPRLAELRKEGEAGSQKINQYTRYGTVAIAFIQSFAMAGYLVSLNNQGAGQVVTNPGIGFTLMTMLTLTTGTAFIMWLGEQITERGIGNGISLIIFAGIVSALPDAMVQTFKSASVGQLSPISLMFVGAVLLAVVATIVFFERGQRRIQIQHAKRMVGRKVYGGHSTFLPLRVNQAGVIPPIFASTLLMFPNTLAGFFPSQDWLNSLVAFGTWQYNTIYGLLIIFFCYFYTAITFQPTDVADNLKKQGAFIPGIRPGKRTAQYIDRVLNRITFGGALYVAAVCILPSFMITEFHIPFYLGGTGLMIVVGVALDTAQQIESHLITRHYDGFTGPKGARIRGRRAR